jgi:hypothetical protein
MNAAFFAYLPPLGAIFAIDVKTCYPGSGPALVVTDVEDYLCIPLR